MNNLEAIWWETQDIDVNKNRIGNPTLHVHFIRKNEEGITHGIVHSKVYWPKGCVKSFV